MEKRSGNLKANFSEIARDLGISRGTIYRVINQSPLVAPDTRNRVIEALNRHGYYTHRRIRRSRILFDFCKHVYLTEMGEFLLKRLPEDEYSCVRTDHRRDIEGFLNAVAACDAAVFCSIPDDRLIETVRRTNPEIFTITLTTESSADVTITPNNKLGGELAARHLIAMGQRDIAVFLSDTHPTRMERYKSFLGEITTLSPDCRVTPVYHHSGEEFAVTFEKFFRSRSTLPDAVFFPAGGFAQTFWEIFSSRGAPYDQIGIMSYDRPEDIFDEKTQFQSFDRIEFQRQHILDWAEYYITNRPMMKKRSPVHTSVGVTLVTAGSIKKKERQQ